jgi:hypothetical protein
MTAEVVAEAAARQCVRYERWYRRVKRAPGKCIKRFPEPTGAEVAETFAPNDTRLWCRIISDGIELAKDPTFRQRCGCPDLEDTDR